ncbi:LysM repeat protein [Actinoplanes octamycinicus]|uniref:LysM repeat protein n=1 Tax=Actinoplanes octamycinicus TaxID=135948 RepID=A0A7W7H6R7_9ACTN|nr:transglycosylase family protein [Actinoplanes octamycinicus]MBB4745045.1 LysM repeat protein [Actinoplanes octamycinicus]GIE55632.1 transglycosylase [Actinoplanes octamycinicus]
MSRIGRRTRLAALTLVAAGVTGAGVLFAPASPAMASSVNWDVVAKCESGGRWHINTGNGYYGGLQFSRSTWKANGGGKYASTADKATKGEQIKIAEKLYAKRGLSPWPVCGKKAGVHKKATSTRKKSTKAKSSKVKSTGKTYVVKSGDTLAKIARKYHIKGGWRTLYKLNKSKLSSPSRIYPGQRIRL